MASETAADKAARLAREKAAKMKAEYERAMSTKRRLIHACNSDLNEIKVLVELPVSKELICQLEVFLESWRESLNNLAETDEILFKHIGTDLTTEEIVLAENDIMKARDDFKRELNLMVAKTKAMAATLAEPEIPRTGPSGRRSFGSSQLFDNGSSIIRLNDVPLPKFNGSYANFSDWYNEFVSAIDKNDRYDDYQKLYLLKRCMTGQAEEMLRDVGTEGSLYKPTLDSIHKTYFNRRRIISEHFATIVDLPAIKNSTIRESVDKVKRCIRGVKVAGIDINAASPLITFLIVRKLPEKLRIDWDTTNHDFSTYPSFDSLAAFLNNRSFAFESTGLISPAPAPKINPVTPSSSKYDGKFGKMRSGFCNSVGSNNVNTADTSSSASNGVLSNVNCVICKQGHFLDLCPVFLQKSVNDRFSFIKINRLCLRCFKPNHGVSSCTRNIKCTICSGNHNRLLHRDNYIRKEINNESSSTKSQLSSSMVSGAVQSTSTPPTTSTNIVSACALGNSKSVFLATAVVKVQSASGNKNGRVFFDQGSEMTLVTKEFCDRAKLKLIRNNSPVKLVGITNGSIEVNWSVNCCLRSRFSDYSIAITADVVEKIPYRVNKADIASVSVGFEYNLAESCDLPYDTVDVLIGSEYAEFILKDRRYFIDGLVYRESYFGYVVMGSTSRCSFFSEKQSFCGLSNSELSEQFRRFVSLDELDLKSEKVLEHDLIARHFESTFGIDERTNRFVIRLPLKETIRVLKGSFGKACAILRNSERRRSEIVSKAYTDIFNEYLSLGHMTKIARKPDEFAYYMPHHIPISAVAIFVVNIITNLVIY